jgi:hypothetical protein
MPSKIFIALICLPLTLNANAINVKKKPVKPQTQMPAAPTITIKNNITPPMLKYWSYSPTSFSIKVNNELIEPGSSKTITRDGNKVIVSYECCFQNGAYKSAKEIEYTLQPDAKEANLTFSWNEKQRVVLSDSTIKHVKELK